MTGVQTCALPIWFAAREKPKGARGAPTSFHKRGSMPGAGTAEWCAPFSGSPPLRRVELVSNNYAGQTQYTEY